MNGGREKEGEKKVERSDNRHDGINISKPEINQDILSINQSIRYPNSIRKDGPIDSALMNEYSYPRVP